MSEILTVRDFIEELKKLDPDAVIVSPNKTTVSAMHVQGVKFIPMKKRLFHANQGYLTPEGKFFTKQQLGGANTNGWWRPCKDSVKAYIVDPVEE